MSDVSQGPGWWQASDGKWYAPQQAPGAQPAPQGQLAEFGPRAIALLIDWVIVAVVVVVGVILELILGAISFWLGLLFGLVLWAVGLVMWLWFGYLVGEKGQSPGMRTQGIRCVSEQTGQPVGGGMGIIRAIAHVLDSLICYIGWLFPLWDPKKQTIADKLAGTVVVTGAPKETFSTDLLKPTP